MGLKAKSFQDFQCLHYYGQQKILSFGQYSMKTLGQPNKEKKRKIIYYFYKNLLNN